MAELIQTYAEVVRDARGDEYTAHAYGEAREGGTWEGWLEFHSASGAVRRTNRETTQPDRDALAYWASGLEPVYQRALVRHTEEGDDWVTLTPEGARLAGLPAPAEPPAGVPHPPKSST